MSPDKLILKSPVRTLTLLFALRQTPESFVKTLLFSFFTLSFFTVLIAQPVPTMVPDQYSVFKSSTRKLIPLEGDWVRIRDGEMPEIQKVPYSSAEPEVRVLEKSIRFGNIQGKSVSIVSNGINHLVSLYLNDQMVGMHQGGYLSLRQSIGAEFLKPNSETKIRMVVDGQLGYNNTLPLVEHPGDPQQTGGVLFPPFIQIAPVVSVDHATLNYKLKDGDLVLSPKIWIKTARFIKGEIPSSFGKTGTISLSLTVTDPAIPELPVLSFSQDVIVTPERVSEVLLPAGTGKIVPWSVSDPKSYLVAVRIYSEGNLIDEISFSTGFRSLVLQGNQMILNGEVKPVRGIVYLENYAETQLSKRRLQLLRDLRIMKTSGVNAIRFWGYPPSPIALNLCDSLGLLAFVEIPAINIPNEILSSGNYTKLMENQLRDLLHRSSSHPSFAAIGLGGNFTTHHDVSILNGLVKSVKTIEPDRIVYGVTRDIEFALQPGSFDMIGFDMNGKTLEEFETVSGRFSEFKNPFIASFGIEVNPGNVNGYDDPFSLQAQAKYFMDRVKLVENSLFVGGFAFSFRDFRTGSPRLNAGGIDPNVVSTGLVNSNSTSRPAMEMLKKLYTDEAVFNPPVGKYRTEIEVIFPIIGVGIIFFFAFFYSSSPRFRDNLSRSFSRSFSFFSDVRDGRIMVGLQSTGLLFLIVVTFSTFFLSLVYSYRFSHSFDYLLSIGIPFNALREMIIWWAWNPIAGIPILSGLILLILVILISMALILGWMFRIRISFSQILISLAWSIAPALILIFPAMVNEQLVARFGDWTVTLVILMAFFMFYLFLRVLKGLRIILVASPAKLYSFAFSGLFILLLATWIHFQYHYDFTSYLSWWLSQKGW